MDVLSKIPVNRLKESVDMEVNLFLLGEKDCFIAVQ